MAYKIGQVFENDYPVDAVKWAEENGAYILQNGTKFTIVAVPAPSLEELKQAKHNAAGAAFAAKRDAIRFVKLSDGNTYGFDCANEDITNFFASWKAAEKDGQTPYKVWMNETTKGMIMLPLADFDTVFDAVRDSQLEAYAWYNATAAAIAAATSKEELEAIEL